MTFIQHYLVRSYPSVFRTGEKSLNAPLTDYAENFSS